MLRGIGPDGSEVVDDAENRVTKITDRQLDHHPRPLRELDDGNDMSGTRSTPLPRSQPSARSRKPLCAARSRIASEFKPLLRRHKIPQNAPQNTSHCFTHSPPTRRCKHLALFRGSTSETTYLPLFETMIGAEFELGESLSR